MTVSSGGETGGQTLAESLEEFEARGFHGQLRARPGGDIQCLTCRKAQDAETFRLYALRRIEGASDPSDEILLGALVCPNCHTPGTLTFAYGTHASPEDSEALRRVEDARAEVHRPEHPLKGGPGRPFDDGVDFSQAHQE